MENNSNDYTVLRTYKSIWKYERKIYSLENIRLLVPVRPSEVLFFASGASYHILFYIKQCRCLLKYLLFSVIS